MIDFDTPSDMSIGEIYTGQLRRGARVERVDNVDVQHARPEIIGGCMGIDQESRQTDCADRWRSGSGGSEL